ncbi:hypothetical protein BKA61DRAFT_640567 [Leptodontidium sp. MPI-SDFR-AT-0119]|nr:hypothetical protein BKA61DRAFT_640567 [Leptodontidium sp. MPI-SDFR-AT-0119]
MAGTKILVLGGTGPAGICVIRELIYRKHELIVYARTPSKIPSDLASNPLLEIIQGTLTSLAPLTDAVSKSSSIISLLGPNIKDTSPSTLPPTLYSDFYTLLFGLMRTHSIRRILAMGTISIKAADDKFSLLRSMVVLLMPLFFNAPYRSVLKIGEVFGELGSGSGSGTEGGGGIDWTVFRIAGIPGGDDEESWKKDRDEGKKGDFVGWVGEKGWVMSQRRGALARWLVDAIEGGADEWIGKMPAVAAGTVDLR